MKELKNLMTVARVPVPPTVSFLEKSDVVEFLLQAAGEKNAGVVELLEEEEPLREEEEKTVISSDVVAGQEAAPPLAAASASSSSDPRPLEEARLLRRALTGEIIALPDISLTDADAKDEPAEALQQDPSFGGGAGLDHEVVADAEAIQILQATHESVLSHAEETLNRIGYQAVSYCSSKQDESRSQKEVLELLISSLDNLVGLSGANRLRRKKLITNIEDLCLERTGAATATAEAADGGGGNASGRGVRLEELMGGSCPPDAREELGSALI